MDELDSHTRGLLDLAKPEFSPSSTELLSLRERLGVLPPEGGGGGGGGGAGGTPVAVWAAVAVTLVLAVGGGLALGSPSHSAVAQAEPIMPSLRPRSTPDKVTPEAVPGREPLDAAQGAARERPAASVVDSSSPSERRRGRKPLSRPAPLHPAKPVPPRPPEAQKPETSEADSGGESLTEELELVVRARQAARSRRWKEVRTLHREHGRRFPNGVFGEESDVLDLVAACSLDVKDADDRARAYLSGSPRFASRVEAACGLSPDR